MGSARQLNGFIDVCSKGIGRARKARPFQSRKEAARGPCSAGQEFPAAALVARGAGPCSAGGLSFTLRAGSGLLAPTQETAVAPRPCDQQNCPQTFPRAPWG